MGGIVLLIVVCAVCIIPAIKKLLVACVYPKGGETNESFLGRSSGGGNRNPYLNNKDEPPSGNPRSAFGEGHAGTKNYSQYGHDTGGNKNYEASNTQLQQDHSPTPVPLPNPKKNSRKNKKEPNSKDRGKGQGK